MFAKNGPLNFRAALFVLVIASMMVVGCQGGTPEVTEVEVTRVVKETQIVTETQVVKEVEVVKETEIVTETEVVKLVYGSLPRHETLIIAGTASNDVWDTFTMMSGPLTNAYSGYQQVAIEQAFLLAGGEYFPYLAQEWEYNDDGTEMTLTITQGATWNDGKPVTMDDWIFSMDYLASHADKGVPFGTLLTRVQYRAEGDDKIVFSFFDVEDPEQPVPNWRFHQSIAGFVPLAQHVWEGQDPMTFKNNPPVEAGPYTLVNCNADTKTCIWERREDYWKEDENLAPRYIVFTRQPEPDLLTQELINGSFDLSQLTPRLAMSVVMPKNENISMVEWPDPCPRHLAFNMDKPPLDDPALRHAISLLIDRERAGNLDNPPAKPIVAPWPYQGEPDPNLLDPSDLTTYDVGVFDPDKAAKLLDDAGYPLVDGKRVDKDGVPISLSVMTFDPSIHGAAVNGFAQMLSEEAAKIGLEITPKVTEVGVFFDSAAKGEFDMMYMWVCGNPMDPLAAYSGLHSQWYQPIGETANFSQHLRYQNPELDELVDQVAEGNPADPALAEAYRELYHIVAEDAPYVPLFALYQGFPWNNEYFTGPADQVEPWYWMYQFRGMLHYVVPADR
jgi:peptide/nickel transport system substrate-binding protein